MRKNLGFTLMELMVGIAIISILSAIAVPNVFQWMRNSQFNASVREMKMVMEDVRLFAVKNNAQATLQFTDGANTFKSVKRTRGGATAETRTHTLDPGVTVKSNFTDDELNYNRRGMLEPLPSTVPKITLESGNGLCREIEVAVTGSARIVQCP